MNLEVPAFWKSTNLEVVEENEPVSLPKFIKRPVPAKVESSWYRDRSSAVVMLAE